MQHYDVALSFAGENRAYVEEVAECLLFHGVKVFYDRFEEIALWGADNVEHFDEVFRTKAQYVVMFISEQYVSKAWPTHERKSSLSRQLYNRGNYILPVRFDDTEVPGLHPTIGYLDLSEMQPFELALRIIRKLGGVERFTPVDEFQSRHLHLEVTNGHRRTIERNNEGVRRNYHVLDFTHRLGKDRLEINLRKAELQAQKDLLEVGFIFVDIEYIWKHPEVRFIECLNRFAEKFTWIQPNPPRNLATNLYWMVNAEKMIATFPFLRPFAWLAGDIPIQIHPHQGPRSNSNDPTRSHTVGFYLSEP